jgi:tetratricopeptide (TPR) repeat protein
MRNTTTLSMIFVIALLAVRMAWAGATENRDREAARIAAKQATAAYNLGQYDEAASLYEEAYRRVPDPIFLYDIGQSYRQANKPDKAMTAYRSYLRTAPENAPNRQRVEAWVRDLERTSALQAKAAAEKGAQENQPPAPVAPALAVPKAPEPQIEPAQVRAAQAAPELVPATPASAPKSALSQPAPAFQAQAAPQPSVPKQGGWLDKKWAWIATGSTVLLGAGALVADLSMYSKIHSSKSYPCGATQYCYTTDDANSINARMATAEVLGGLAAAAAVTTILLFIFEGQPASVAPVAGGMTGALARVEF